MTPAARMEYWTHTLIGKENNMNILYEADDGTIFDNEYDCLFYEEKKDHLNLEGILIYTKNNVILGFDLDDLLNEKYYYQSEKVILHNEKEFKDFIWLAEYCGWCEWYDFITSPGIWVRYEENGNGCWKKVDKLTL